MSARAVAWVVAPDCEPVFSERATRIEIDDEAGGEFVIVTGQRDGDGKVAIDPDEWPEIRAAIDAAVSACRKDET